MVRAVTTTLFAASMCVTGCGVTGEWESESLAPEIARDEFRLFGSVASGMNFTSAVITIQDGGRFSAEVHYGPLVEQVTGTWEKSGEKITFVDSLGRSETYRYDLSDDQKELKIVKPIEGSDVVVTLARK